MESLSQIGSIGEGKNKSKQGNGKTENGNKIDVELVITFTSFFLPSLISAFVSHNIDNFTCQNLGSVLAPSLPTSTSERDSMRITGAL